MAQRTLLELYSHLQQHQGTLKIMSDEPLQVTDSLALSRFHALIDRGGLIDTLLDLAVTHIDGAAPIVHDDWHDFRGRVLRGLAPPSWAKQLNAGGDEPEMELWFSWTDAGDRPEEPRDQPIFLASLTMNTPSEQCRAALHDPEWRLPDWAFPVVDLKSKQARISAIRYVAEVATAGITLSARAEQLGRWAMEALADLATLPSPPGLGRIE